MCGLGSITLSREVVITAAKLDDGAKALLKALDHRGGHATGMTVVLHDGQVGAQKAPVNASEFEVERWRVPEGTRAIAVHTRMATKGKPHWIQNNHPVTTGDGSVQLMHNGVVYDGHVERRAGNPLVDTFALAEAVDAVRKKKGNEGWINYSERLVRACANVSGSQTLQIAVRGLPVLVSARVRINPLFVCETDGVRVTASTREAVSAGVKALGLKVPTELIEWQTRRKGKSRTHTHEQELIYAAEDGDVLIWGDGEHLEGWIEGFAPQFTKPAPKYGGSPTTPSTGKAWSTTSKPSSAPVERKGLLATPWAKGTDVKTPLGRRGTIEEVVENGGWRAYKLELHADIDPLDLTPRSKAHGQFSETILERWWPSDTKAQEATRDQYEAKLLAKQKGSTSVEVVKHAKAGGMTGYKDRRDNRAELADFVEPQPKTHGVQVVKGTDGYPEIGPKAEGGICDICTEWAATRYVTDGLLLCNVCEFQVAREGMASAPPLQAEVGKG